MFLKSLLRFLVPDLELRLGGLGFVSSLVVMDVCVLIVCSLLAEVNFSFVGLCFFGKVVLLLDLDFPSVLTALVFKLADDWSIVFPKGSLISTVILLMVVVDEDFGFGGL